jgi:hypothetical protein
MESIDKPAFNVHLFLSSALGDGSRKNKDLSFFIVMKRILELENSLWA